MALWARRAASSRRAGGLQSLAQAADTGTGPSARPCLHGSKLLTRTPTAPPASRRHGSVLAGVVALAAACAAALAASPAVVSPGAAQLAASGSAPDSGDAQLVVRTSHLFKIPAGSVPPNLADDVRGDPGAPATGGSRGSFLVSSRSIPAGVSRSRFLAVVRSNAAFRRLSARGWTSTSPGSRDGKNVVGFASKIPAGDLGVQIDWVIERPGKQPRVVERDIVLDPSQPWEDGPRRPDSQHYDLETVLLHELGHFAGIKDHKPRCTNSPMIEALAKGEWWRSSDDWFNWNCAKSPSSPRGQVARAGRHPRPAKA
jgi:hypothetical protein